MERSVKEEDYDCQWLEDKGSGVMERKFEEVSYVIVDLLYLDLSLVRYLVLN